MSRQSIKPKVLEYVSKYPGSSTQAIGMHLGIHPDKMAAYLYNYIKAKNPELRRDQISGPKGNPFFVYFLVEKRSENATLPDTSVSTKSVISKPETLSVPSTPISDTLQETLTKTVSLLADALATEIMKSLEPVLATKLKTLVSSLSDSPTLAEPSATIPRDKIMIVGLLEGQGKMVEREFKDCFKVKNYTVQTPADRLTSAARNADHVILMTSFISHRHQDAVKRAAKDLVLISGGMTELRDKLTELYVETPT